MSRLSEVLIKNKRHNRKSLIVYTMGGCPDASTSLRAICALREAGADAMEIGIPFSDPMADGPVIQRASTLALTRGITTSSILHLIRTIRHESEVPLAVMTYVNTVLQFGPAEFINQFRSAGVDGLIVPDMPIEESALVEPLARNAGMNLIHFIAPTTTTERIGAICQKAEGFLYCVAATGVTGVRKQQDFSGLKPLISQAREVTNMPIAIGFGIGSPEAAASAAQLADAVIVGSAVVEYLMAGELESAVGLIRSIRNTLDTMG